MSPGSGLIELAEEPYVSIREFLGRDFNDQAFLDELFAAP
jgi:hypothetical protein